MGARYEVYPERSWTLLLGRRVEYRWRLVLDDIEVSDGKTYHSRAQAYFGLARFAQFAGEAPVYDLDTAKRRTPLGTLRAGTGDVR